MFSADNDSLNIGCHVARMYDMETGAVRKRNPAIAPDGGRKAIL